MGCGSSKVAPLVLPKAPENVIIEDPETVSKVLALSIDIDDTLHHTLEYNKHTLGRYHVVRRGAAIKFPVELDGHVKDSSSLSLTIQNITVGRPPVVVARVVAPTEQVCWSLEPDADGGSDTTKFSNTAILHLPPTFPVGEFNVKILVAPPPPSSGGDDVALTKPNEDGNVASINIVVIFNPWCVADEAYVHDATMRDEYVMNPQGIIFTGMTKNVNPFTWSYGQFDPEVMKCTLHLLKIVAEEVYDDEFLDSKATADIVYLTRRLTSMANANDNAGVLLGSWSGDYSDGASPGSWSSTSAIMSQYMRSMVDESGNKKQAEPVRYGQCFTFAGLLTGMLRCLGIAARPISCFGSAHDQRGRGKDIDGDGEEDEEGGYNCRIEKYFDAEGNSMEEISESIWSFHVWTEAWFARVDLKSVGDGAYGGWQVLDATPQETSETWYQCGPAPVTAIKKGETNSQMKYDVAFVYGEVNADVYYYKSKTEDEKQKERELEKESEAPTMKEWSVLRIDTKRVAPFLLTKSMGEIDYEGMRNIPASSIPDKIPNAVNVMSDYKYPEGSASERAVQKQAEGPLRTSVSEPNVVEFELTASHDGTRWSRPALGESFDVMLHMKEIATATAGDEKAPLQVSGRIEVHLIRASGRSQSLVSAQSFGPESLTEKKVLSIEAAQYLSLLKTSDFTFELRAFATVVDHPQTFVATEVVMLESPAIEVVASSKIEVGKEATFWIRFENPADLVLESSIFKVDGDIIDGNPSLEIGMIGAKASVEKELKFVPLRQGTLALHVRLESLQLNGLIQWNGEFTVQHQGE
eukprot:m.267065 g.267065  ORF g.267065 m.267065 type:complete len:808 (-) comp70895_c0_seq1:125-2548(-)